MSVNLKSVRYLRSFFMYKSSSNFYIMKLFAFDDKACITVCYSTKITQFLVISNIYYVNIVVLI